MTAFNFGHLGKKNNSSRCLYWAIIPVRTINILLFLKINTQVHEEASPLLQLFTNKLKKLCVIHIIGNHKKYLALENC